MAEGFIAIVSDGNGGESLPWVRIPLLPSKRKTHMNKHILSGLSGLASSRKGTLSILIFGGSLTALLLGKLDGMSFAAIVSTVAVIYNYCQHKVDLIHTNG